MPGFCTQLQDQWHQLTILMWDRSPAFRTAIVEATRSFHQTQMERSWLRDENECNQHHYAFEEQTEMIEVFDGIKRGMEEESLERGRVYMHGLQLEYGGAGFASNTTYGQCERCDQGISVWRNCPRCIAHHQQYGNEDFLSYCLNCPESRHQDQLLESTRCTSECPALHRRRRPKEMDTLDAVPSRRQRLQ